MIKGDYKITIRQHVINRAIQRKICPDLIKETIQTGKMKKFGKNRVKFEKKFRRFVITCVDEIIRNTIFIVTIEKKRR
ncbi:MAG: hypothetical protein ABH821_00440 [archaeon]